MTLPKNPLNPRADRDDAFWFCFVLPCIWFDTYKNHVVCFWPDGSKTAHVKNHTNPRADRDDRVSVVIRMHRPMV